MQHRPHFPWSFTARTAESASTQLLAHASQAAEAGFPGCCNPTNLALTPEGCVVVTEKAGPRVKLYGRDGALVEIIATDLFDPGCKNMDVAVDAQGRVYVVDTVERVIQVFEPVRAEAEP